MAFSDVQAKLTVTGFTTAQRDSIIADLKTAYEGSAIAKKMFDDWIAVAGHTINISKVAGVYQAYAGTGRVEIDPAYITDLSYVNDKGTPVLHSQIGALLHELSHALHGTLDNISATDYQGDNVKFTNTIWAQLSGLDKEISYIAQARNDIHKVGYQYTNGTAIDAARSGDVNMNSTALGASNDLLIGGPSANTLQAGPGNDFIFGDGGDDQLFGSDGADTAVYFGSPLDYDVRKNADDTWSVRNVRGAKDAGSDMLTNVEKIQFDKDGGGLQTFDLIKNGLTFQTDFAIVVDTTGSMGPYINGVKTAAAGLVDAAFAGGKADARIGVVSFKDNTNGEPTAVVLPFTDQDNFDDRKTAAIAAINTLGASGGGDTPETAFDGLRVALDGTMGQWRAGAGTLRVALFTDAPAKDGALAGLVSSLASNIGATIETHASLAGLGGSVDTFGLAFGSTTDKTFGPAIAGQLFGDDTPDEPTPTFPFEFTEESVTPYDSIASVQIFTILTTAPYFDTTDFEDIASENGGRFLVADDPDALVKALFGIIEGTLDIEIALSNNEIAENSPSGDVIGALSATSGDEEDTFTYALLDNADGLFGIQGADLIVTGPLDFEQATMHDITVQVSDSSGNTFNKTFTIDVTNVTGASINGLSAADLIDATHTVKGQARPTAEEDTINGMGGNDVISGLAGNDVIFGGTGYDKLYGNTGNDTLNGDAGSDTLYGNEGDDILNGGADNDILFGSAGNDILDGGAGYDTLNGNWGDDRLGGGIGNDILKGDEGSDVLTGGAGKDILTGGADNDQFFFNTITDSTAAASDVITDFSNGDTINLSLIDANTASPGIQMFLLGGYSSRSMPNSLTWFESNGNTYINADVNGDVRADMTIVLTGVNHQLDAGDFNLLSMPT